MSFRVILVAAGAMLAGVPAMADPISALAAVLAPALGAAAPFVAQLIGAVVGFAISALIAKARGAQAESAKGVKFDVEFGDNLPLSFTVGDYATAGKRRYIGTWGKNNRYITEVIEVTALPQALQKFWVNDERAVVNWGSSEQDGTGHNIGYPLDNHQAEDGSTRIWVRWIDGTQTAADPMLRDVFSGDPDYPWTSAFVGTGKAYAIVTCRYDEETLSSYPTFLWQPAPLALYDPRKDSSVGGSGAHRWGNAATYEETRNAAVIAYNIARGIYFGSEWVFGGKNLPAWRLPLNEWVAAMNAADAGAPVAGGGTEPSYRAGLNITVDLAAADVLEELGRAANMRFAEVGGMLKSLIDLPAGAVFSFTDESVVVTQGQSLRPFTPLAETFNAVAATYPEPDEKWAMRDAPVYIDSEATAQDGGRYLPTFMSYAAAPYRRQVQRLMRSQMRDYRRMRQHQFHLPPEAYALEPLDVVAWSSERNGYSNKLFLVETVVKQPGMNVSVSLREVDPSDYDWSSDYEQPVTIVTPVNPVRPVQPINGLTVQGVAIQDTDGLNRRPAIEVSCDGDEVGVGQIRIQVRKAGETYAEHDLAYPFGDPFTWYVQPVLPSETYEVRARLQSNLTPRSSWSSWVTVTTPFVGLGLPDFDESIAQWLAELSDWITGGLTGLPGQLEEMAGSTRLLREDVRRIAVESLDAFSSAEALRSEIRRELRVEVGGSSASFSEAISILADETNALAQELSTLDATVNGNTASITSLAQSMSDQFEAQAISIEQLESSLGDKADASALTALQTTVSDLDGEVTATSTALTEVSSRVGNVYADGLFRIETLATPSGSLSRIGLFAAATGAEGWTRDAALFLEAVSGGKSRVVIDANQFAVVNDGSGARMTWEDNALRVYDTSGDLVFIAGDLS